MTGMTGIMSGVYIKNRMISMTGGAEPTLRRKSELEKDLP